MLDNNGLKLPPCGVPTFVGCMLMSIPKCTKKGIYLCTKRGMKLYT